MATLQPAPLSIYIDWLRTHLSEGCQPTHGYDYPYPADWFLLATAPFTTGDERGVHARNILVASGIQHVGGDLGHNQLFLFDEGPLPTVIPIYSNPEFLVLPGIADFLAEEKRRGAAFWAKQERMRAASEAAMRESDVGRYVLGQR